MAPELKLKVTQVTPADILTAADTIPGHRAETLEVNLGWTPPAVYLEWARRGLSDGDDHGLDNAITYSKRAACCRIDRLVDSNHLSRIRRATYPAKIETLEKLGISIPSVIGDLVIDPRNEIEHSYSRAIPEGARHAVDVATLFVDATSAVDRPAIIALNWNILYSVWTKGEHLNIEFKGWSAHPMLFVDTIETPHAAKIVDPARGEVLTAELDSFSTQEAISLARILRKPLYLALHSFHGNDELFYAEMKRQGGF